MSSIVEVVTSSPCIQPEAPVTSHDDSRSRPGKLIQANYILNDTGALKKKLRHETARKDPYNEGTEAKDGSNMVFLLKTSFFEHVKAQFVDDLASEENISGITNVVATKA